MAAPSVAGTSRPGSLLSRCASPCGNITRSPALSAIGSPSGRRIQQRPSTIRWYSTRCSACGITLAVSTFEGGACTAHGAFSSARRNTAPVRRTRRRTSDNASPAGAARRADAGARSTAPESFRPAARLQTLALPMFRGMSKEFSMFVSTGFSTRVQRRHGAPSLRALAVAALGALALSAHAGEPRERAAWCADRCDQLVIDWNTTAYQVIKAVDGYADPLHASRALAMMHLAMHDAANAVSPRFATYLQVERDASADAAVAAASAAHGVLQALYPQAQAAPLLRAAFDSTLLDAGNS